MSKLYRLSLSMTSALAVVLAVALGPASPAWSRPAPAAKPCSCKASAKAAATPAATAMDDTVCVPKCGYLNCWPHNDGSGIWLMATFQSACTAGTADVGCNFTLCYQLYDMETMHRFGPYWYSYYENCNSPAGGGWNGTAYGFDLGMIPRANYEMYVTAYPWNLQRSKDLYANNIAGCDTCRVAFTDGF